MSRLNRTILIFGVSILLVLVLSACSIVVHTEINEDGSGEFVFIISMSEEFLLTIIEEEYYYDFNSATDEPLEFLLSQSGYYSVDELCEELNWELESEGFYSEISGVESDGGFECYATIEFLSVEELEMLHYEAEFDEFNVNLDEEGNFTYRVVGDSYEMDFDDFMDYQEYGIEVEFLWKVTAPGKITSHNGSKSGNTVTWDLLEVAEQGGIIVMEVKSEKSSGGIDIGGMIGGDDPVREPSGGGGGGGESVGLIIVLAIVVVMILASSQKKKPESED